MDGPLYKTNRSTNIAWPFLTQCGVEEVLDISGRGIKTPNWSRERLRTPQSRGAPFSPAFQSQDQQSPNHHSEPSAGLKKD